MLYERWMQIAAERPGELALHDTERGERWTFAQLRDEADRAMQPEGKIQFIERQGAEFVIELLRGWKHGLPCCPLESRQPKPSIESVPDECAHIKLTSGTTGAPLQIAFSAEQIFADAENIVSTMGLRREWPNIGVISMAHSYGFSNLVTPLLLFGIPLVIGKNPLPQAVAEILKQDCTVPAVPALWRAWHEGGVKFGHVKLAISAGAPLPLALETGVFQQQGLKIHNFYGSSECGGIAYDRTSVPRTNPSLAGSAMDNVQLSVNHEGCLRVTSKAVGMSYLPSLPRLSNGSFTTNDLVEIKDGEIFLLGRSADTINVAGRKVAPEKIEQALLKLSGVKEAVVFGMEDSARGEDIVACIAGIADVEQIKRDLSHVLQTWEMPREWYAMREAPRNERGKVSRAQLREHHKKGFASLPGFRLLAR